MKRENFTISFDGKKVVKHAWNSANREVERLIAEIANEEGCIFRLTNKESVKVGFVHVSGFREWTGDNGKVVTFVIQKDA